MKKPTITSMKRGVFYPLHVFVSCILGTKTHLRQYSTKYTTGKRPKYCWHLHWGNGMACISCNYYGISLLDARRWRVGCWSRIRSFKFTVLTLILSIDMGEVAPYNPLTGVEYN